MKPRLLVVLGVAMALLAISYRHRGGGPTSFQELKFDAAIAKARAENKLVMVDFFATWCGPCRMLDENTWPDAKVRREVEEKVVAIRVDVDKEPELTSRYQVEAFPTVLFLKADGRVAGQLVGYLAPEEFLPRAREIVEEASTATRPQRGVDRR